MKSPAVSVLIPVYNVEKYLDICLQSVINQTFKDFEIICLNDGSTDNSAQILASWAEKEPRLKIMIQKNQGLSVARNHLLEEARGAYVAFVDADDMLDPRYLQKLCQAALVHKSEVTTCFFDHISADGTQRTSPRLPKYYYVEPSQSAAERFLCGFYNPIAPGKLFKRQFLQENHLAFWQGRRAEDVPFSIQAYLLARRITYVKEPLYLYRQRGSSSLSNNRVAMTVDMLRNLQDLCDVLKQRNLWRPEVARVWIRGIVWYVARFHKLTHQERFQYLDLQQQAWQQAKGEGDCLPWLQKCRWKLLFWLVDTCGWQSVYFWSRIFR